MDDSIITAMAYGLVSVLDYWVLFNIKSWNAKSTIRRIGKAISFILVFLCATASAFCMCRVSLGSLLKMF